MKLVFYKIIPLGILETEFYRKKLEENGLEALITESQKTRNYIRRTVKEELSRGLIQSDTKENYILIVKELVRRGAEGIILGCTEIPLLISRKILQH